MAEIETEKKKIQKIILETTSLSVINAMFTELTKYTNNKTQSSRYNSYPPDNDPTNADR